MSLLEKYQMAKSIWIVNISDAYYSLKKEHSMRKGGPGAGLPVFHIQSGNPTTSLQIYAASDFLYFYTKPSKVKTLAQTDSFLYCLDFLSSVCYQLSSIIVYFRCGT